MSTPSVEQWIEACADHYMTAGGLPAETAVEFAKACADSQADINGPASEWDSPSDAADEDMSYWENDE